MQIRHCGYLLAGFLMAPPGLAQNLVANSAFTTGVDGWTGSGFSWDASDGDPAPGSLRLTSSGTLVISGCMPIAGEQMVHVAMNARAFDSSHQAEAKADVF